MSPKEQENAFIQFGYYTALVTQMAMSMAAGVVLGYWLDRKFNTSPILTLLGTILGMTAGIYNLIQIINYFKRKEQRGKGRSGTDEKVSGKQ